MRDSLKEVAAVLVCAALMVGLTVVSSVAVDHEHGGNVPDWYDGNCCNNNDCAPVSDKDIDFGIDAAGQPVVRYTWHRPGYEEVVVIEYTREKWKASKDERYHTCHQGRRPLCVYIPAGV